MSHKATAWAFAQRVPPLQKLVLIVLADRHNADTGRCDPSLSRIAEDCTLSRDTVIRNLKALASAGLLRIIRRVKPADGNTGTIQGTNFYVLGFDNYTPKSANESGGYFDEIPSQTGGVVANSDQGSSSQLLGVVANSYPNQEVEPVMEPGKKVEASPLGGVPQNSFSLNELIRGEMFPYYCDQMGRNRLVYTLTQKRLEKGVLRLEECLKKSGDIRKAREMFWRAIEGLRDSDFHQGQNDRHTKYNDWIDHLCKSPECFEKWIEKGMA